jgi:hypothetical protein
VIAPGTRHLLGSLFELADLGAHALKGFSEPVRAWQVVGAGVSESRFDALRGRHLIPLVGREEELHLLLSRCPPSAPVRQIEGFRERRNSGSS